MFLSFKFTNKICEAMTFWLFPDFFFPMQVFARNNGNNGKMYEMRGGGEGEERGRREKCNEHPF